VTASAAPPWSQCRRLVVRGDLVLHGVVHGTRDADATRLREALEPRSHVDAGTVDVLGVDPDVADVHAHAKRDALLRRRIREQRGECGLHVERSSDRTLGGRELRQESVARELDDAAAMARNGGIDDVAARAAPVLDDSRFVELHQARVAGDVGR
jgi:hypothetical protein